MTANELKELRERLRLRQEEMAEHLGIDRGRYKNWELPERSGPPDQFVDAILALEERLAHPLVIQSSSGAIVNYKIAPMVKVKVLGNIQAGEGAFNVDVAEEYQSLPASIITNNSIAFRIDGDSMMPALRQNDIAIFEPSQTRLKGKIYLLKSSNDGLRCKQLAWRNNEWTLVSYNPSPQYPDEPLGDHAVLGIMTGLYRSIGDHHRTESRFSGITPEDLE